MLKHSYQSSTLASRERRFSLSSSSEEEGERMTAEVARRIWNMQGEQGEDRSGELKVEGVEKNGGSEVDLSRVEGGQESGGKVEGRQEMKGKEEREQAACLLVSCLMVVVALVMYGVLLLFVLRAATC